MKKIINSKEYWIKYILILFCHFKASFEIQLNFVCISEFQWEIYPLFIIFKIPILLIEKLQFWIFARDLLQENILPRNI